ncbi:MAG: hypothetical protein R3D29_03355 [Nitratireductor sp.]
MAIARALVSNPEVIFADEPTAALDKTSGLAAVTLLKDLGRSRGTTTVMVTHDPAFSNSQTRSSPSKTER